MDFNNISWIKSRMLYVVSYFKISTFVHTFLGDNMHCKVCVVHYWVRPLSCVQKSCFPKTELLWKPNFRGGPEAVRFSQIILYSIRSVSWRNWLEHQSSRRKVNVLESSPILGNNFAICYSRFLRVSHSSSKQIQMKPIVTYTWQIPCCS